MGAHPLSVGSAKLTPGTAANATVPVNRAAITNGFITATVVGSVGSEGPLPAAPQVIDNLPHKPVEPEAAALEMNVRVPGDVFHTHAFTPWSSARVPVTGP